MLERAALLSQGRSPVPLRLSIQERLDVFIYECGVSALPTGLRSHPRVRIRDKRGALSQRDPFFSFFDHVVQSYPNPNPNPNPNPKPKP